MPAHRTSPAALSGSPSHCEAPPRALAAADATSTRFFPLQSCRDRHTNDPKRGWCPLPSLHRKWGRRPLLWSRRLLWWSIVGLVALSCPSLSVLTAAGLDGSTISTAASLTPVQDHAQTPQVWSSFLVNALDPPREHDAFPHVSSTPQSIPAALPSRTREAVPSSIRKQLGRLEASVFIEGRGGVGTGPHCYDSVQEVIICEGEMDFLHCPDTGGVKGIYVYEAFFGRGDSDICTPAPVLGDCSLDVTKLIQDGCDTQHQCLVYAHFYYFGHPCDGPKYLHIRYKCHCGVPEDVPPSRNAFPPLPYVPLQTCQDTKLPPSMSARIKCDEDSDFVSCEMGKEIHVYYAGYGRKDQHQCRPTPSFDEDKCRLRDITQDVSEKCNGETYCDLKQLNASFATSFCPATAKYEQVAFICMCQGTEVGEIPPTDRENGTVQFPFVPTENVSTTPLPPGATARPGEETTSTTTRGPLTWKEEALQEPFPTPPPRTNFALEKEASQSSTSERSEAWLPVDGQKSMSRVGSSPSCTKTVADIGWDPWWRVDLKDSHPVWGVSITARDRLRGAEIWIGNNACAFRSPGNLPCIPKGGVQSNWEMFGTTLIECQKLADFGWPEGRYVWVAMPGDPSTVLSLCEVEVLGYYEHELKAIQRERNLRLKAIPPNLAFHRPTDHFPKPVVSTTSSPAELDPNRPVQEEEEEQEASVPHASSLAVDGTLSSTLCSETLPGKRPWWRVELTRPYTIGAVRILNRKTHTDWIDGVEVYVGPSVSSYDDPANAQCVVDVTPPDFPPGEFTQLNCSNLPVGQYVWLVLPELTGEGEEGRILSLCEVEVWQGAINPGAGPGGESFLVLPAYSKDEPCMWSAFRSLRPLSRVPPEGKVTSAILCQYRCQQVRDCRGFHWREDTNMCTLTAAYGREVVEPTNSPLDVIGPKYCSCLEEDTAFEGPDLPNMPIKGEALKRPSARGEVMIDAPLVCQELCQQSPNCNGFTYVGGATKGEDRPDAQACYLKRERRMDDKDAHNANVKGYITGPKGCGGLLPDKEYPGNDMAGMPLRDVTSEIECQSMCQSKSSAKCQFFTHYHSNVADETLRNTCWLKKAKIDTVPPHVRGAVSGPRYS